MLHRAPLSLDAYRKQAVVDGKPVALSPKEYRLLVLLASPPGRVVTISEILAELWPSQTAKVATIQDAQKYIYLLRQKVEEDPASPQLILNVRGLGYRLAWNHPVPALQPDIPTDTL